MGIRSDQHVLVSLACQEWTGDSTDLQGSVCRLFDDAVGTAPGGIRILYDAASFDVECGKHDIRVLQTISNHNGRET